ncbi:hypothetical protein [Dethiobacter alkaliphilus]|uniref:Uncharacterized protein n=1 Tax=Dethiobacter alkaliphilus AHT 1 TaxID=555088 RepID=C0GD34_DETAL|nr:hypothetical protein [Dethiobacter alkaliphilus]EEG79119.1 hypothetical protein DealDRAFT_0393 [Dethiobacter alkaliphilus AHT 1]
MGKRTTGIHLREVLSEQLSTAKSWGQGIIVDRKWIHFENGVKVVALFSSFIPGSSKWWYGISEKDYRNDPIYVAFIMHEENRDSYLLLEPNEVKNLLMRCSMDKKKEKKINLIKRDEKIFLRELPELTVDENIKPLKVNCTDTEKFQPIENERTSMPSEQSEEDSFNDILKDILYEDSASINNNTISTLINNLEIEIIKRFKLEKEKALLANSEEDYDELDRLIQISKKLAVMKNNVNTIKKDWEFVLKNNKQKQPK